MLDAFWDKSPLRSVIDGFLHEPGKLCEKDRARHALFIGVHLAVGLLALATLPLVVLASGGGFNASVPGLALLPVWMLAPLISVLYLSKTGNLGNAFLLTAATTAAFVIWVATMTGGIKSPHLIWLGVIPLEVALSGNQKIIKQALLVCLAALAALGAMEAAQILDHAAMGEEGISMIGAFSIMAAIVYGGALAVRIDLLHRERLCMLQAEEMRYRSIADTISDMITRHDRSGDVTFASATASCLLNVQQEALLGSGLFQMIHIPDRPKFLQALSDCMNRADEDQKPVTVEVRIMAEADEIDGQGGNGTKGTSLCWCEMKCAPERDEQGMVIGAIAATRDISKRKQQQFAMEDARSEAEQANESKTRFLANVTHELRTPLNTIIGFSEILCHPELIQNNQDKSVEYAELIHKGGNHLLQLVNALLDMSRIESGNFEVVPQKFDIVDLSESCCKMMQADAASRGIALFSKNEESIAETCLDPRACRQILLNLISNALKFSDKGDKVMVSVKWARDKRGIKLDDMIDLIVSDNGIGIDKEDIPKLGKPFVQAENSLQRRFEGTGIGLSIVHGLANLQNGQLSIDSELGIGTTVKVTLPVDMLKGGTKSRDIASEPVIAINKHAPETALGEIAEGVANAVSEQDRKSGNNKANRVA
nr:PAS domain-containing sensor histidine kinase [uncultured Cohaesibacter sp.]